MSILKDSINDSVNFFKNNIKPICLIILPIVIPIEIVSAVVEHYHNDRDTFSTTYWLPLLLGLLLYPIYQGALIFYIVSAITNEYLPLKQYYQLAIKFWFPLFFLYLITSGVVLAGIIFFIVPGIFAMSRVVFSEFYCLLHKQSSSEAFSSSWNKTKEHQWLILKGIIIIYSLILLPYITLSYIIGALSLWNPLISIIIGCSLSVFLSLITIFSFRIYTLDPDNLN